ncbi:shikimate dehydrogenase [Terrihabitans rhizophilus]|uniref:Shikimate dehydrogenase (NADP(+)) n=1 Tax=Terrihabitans rhizophilus TaxID=3092662 RepID=A0ABU4RRP6_9HYPH|nr:shikimate dehydrogenase [Terrihabitans sp. PJ23]MDX6807530.1 shikimate dehydrogenase [Terrihabitans sp. PJ23]
MTDAPRACVIGWPIAHSRSPMIHGYWLAQHGIAGSYGKTAVHPDDLGAFMQRVRSGEFRGCNVTVPHKEAVMSHLDEITETARAIGAVNTVWRDDDGRLVGDNTDARGFLSNLDELVPGWDKAPLRAVVLGAGGAARALAYGLAGRGAERITLLNRSLDRAIALAGDIGGVVQARPLDEAGPAMADATLLANATSLGMTGKDPLDLDLDALPLDAVVSDIVYVPLETDLLRQAAMRGHRTAEGLGMLLHQAVPGFERWFGTRPAVDPRLRSLVEADIRSALP